MSNEKTSLTYGEKQVGITFNPDKNPDVAAVKRLTADLIDLIDGLRMKAFNGEQAAQFTLAIRNIRQGQQWAVSSIFYPVD